MKAFLPRVSLAVILCGVSCAPSQGLGQPAISNSLEQVRAVLASALGTTHGLSTESPAKTALDPRANVAAAYLTNAVSSLALTNPADRQAFVSRLEAQRKAIQQLWQAVDDTLQVNLRPGVGTPMQIKARLLERPTSGLFKMVVVDRDRQTAATFLTENRAILLLNDPHIELVLAVDETDDLGHRHLRYTQQYAGLPVWPCGLSVHLDSAGNVYLLDGAFVPSPTEVAGAPEINAASAQQFARASVENGTEATVGAAELVIHAPLDGPPRLAWKMGVAVDVTHSWIVVIDAVTGKSLRALSHCMEENLVGSGVDLLGVNRTLNVWHQNGQYYMIDTSKPMFNAADGTGTIEVDDARGTPESQVFVNGQLQNLFYVISPSAVSWTVPDAVSAAFNLSETYDYYSQRHGRTSYDNKGSDMVGVVRLGGLANAFWNQAVKHMMFGDVDLYAASLDVIGHEVTHAVTGSSAQLVYENQSGALNEAMSDVFGEMIEARTLGQNDWLIGSDLKAPLRRMDDPSALFISGSNRRYPDRMSQFIAPDDPFLANFPQRDHGGVHLNSGIVNKAFYLLTEGLTDAVGRLDATKIFYQSLTKHLEAQSQFIDARIACINSAEELFGVGSIQALKTGTAFDVVEIYGAPAAPDPTRIPAVQADDSFLCLYQGIFDSTGSIWRREALKGDPIGGTKLIGNAARSKLFVSGDGSVAVYVTAQNDLGLVATDGSTSTTAGLAGLVHSVTISPDGRYAAFVFQSTNGVPLSKIGFVDTLGTNRVFDLVAPAIDGGVISNVVYADAMDISYDGKLLVYDALSGVRRPNGTTNTAWSIFGIDLTTGITKVVVPPVEGFDIGNPSLSRTSARYLTCDARHRSSGNTAVINLDLQTGELAIVSPILNDFAYPCFNGDDTAVVFTASDSLALHGLSLYRQGLLPDHLTTNGAASVVVRDGWQGVVYRRGIYTSTNSPPSVQLTGPADGTSVPYPAQITIQATAADTDGSVAVVQFYQGSQKLGEAASSPYSMTWTSATPGTYRLFARAIDNLGAATDSTPVTFTVKQSVPLKITSVVLQGGNGVQINAVGSAGLTNAFEFSPDLVDWTVLTNVVNTTGTLQVRDTVAPGQASRFYRVRQE
jgi:bacillolysin